MTITKRYARILDNTKIDNERTIAALKLQAQAWRLLTMIALVDQEKARKTARWLLFKTVPWVDGEALTKFIADNQVAAEEATEIVRQLWQQTTWDIAERISKEKT